MAIRFFDHAADLGFEITARTLPDLFAEAATAFTRSLTEVEQIEERETRRFALAAPDAERLLVDWLSELLAVFEVEHLLIRRAEVEVEQSGDDFRLRAVAHGEIYDPQRHPIKVLVKAVTYHGLRVEERRGEWRARVILDI